MNSSLKKLADIASVIVPGLGTLLGGPAFGIILSKLSSVLFDSLEQQKNATVEDMLQRVEHDPDAFLKIKTLEHDIEIKELILLQNQESSQQELNKIDAISPNSHFTFRIFIGWVLGITLALNLLIFPILKSVGYNTPNLEIEKLFPMLLGLLGLGS